MTDEQALVKATFRGSVTSLYILADWLEEKGKTYEANEIRFGQTDIGELPMLRYGNEDGYGDGIGYGNGDGDGYGDGYGYGYENGNGDGYGCGNENGDGSGDRYGDGDGDGYGYGFNLTSY